MPTVLWPWRLRFGSFGPEPWILRFGFLGPEPWILPASGGARWCGSSPMRVVDVEPKVIHVVLGQGVYCLVPAPPHLHWPQGEAVLDLEVGELLHDRVDRVALKVALA